MACVGEILPRRGSQQFQECHLHHINGISFNIQIGKLGIKNKKTHEDSLALLCYKGIKITADSEL